MSTTSTSPNHFARLSAALQARGIEASQTDNPAVWTAPCPSCKGDVQIRDADWAGRRRLQLYCKTDPEPTILRTLGLRESDLCLESPAVVHDASRGDVSASLPVVTRASDVRSRKVEWCYKGRWPLGYLTIQTGEEKIGKTVMFIRGAADLTNGQLPGKYLGRPMPVLIVAVEDSREDMWKPRLEAAGADLELVSFLDIPDGWNVRDGTALLEAGLQQTEAPLLFIDAVMEHLPEPQGGENANSSTFIRSSLRPVATLTERWRGATVMSTHPPKRRAVGFSDFYSASAAFTQVSRSCLLFGWHPDDQELPEEQRRRVLLRARANVGRDPGGLSFRIDTRWLTLDDGNEDEVPYATDVEACTITIRDLLRADRPQGPDPEQRQPGKQEHLEQLIADYLADDEWHPNLTDTLKADGWAHGTIQAARSKVAKTRKQTGVMAGAWQWRLLEPPSSHSVDSSTLLDVSRARSVYVEADSSTLTPPTPITTEESKSQESATNHGDVGPEESKSQPAQQTPRARPACCCADGGSDPTDDGLCSRCFGWPKPGGDR